MALNSYPPLGADGLTADERLRQTIRTTLRAQFPDLSDDEIWDHALALTNALGVWFPPPFGLVYAWSDGQTYSTVDRDAGIPDNARERAILRALLGYVTQQLDRYEDPLAPVPMGVAR